MAWAGSYAAEAGTIRGRSRQDERRGFADERDREARAGLVKRTEERLIFGVPARFMVPRITLAITTFGLVALGMLMIYSASSITALTDPDVKYNAAYYVVKQLRACAIGLVALLVIAKVDYHVWAERGLVLIWIATVVLLLLIFTKLSHDAYGATRWISIGGFSLQPSEFAKITVILTGANIATRYYDEHSVDYQMFGKMMVLGVGVPLALIVLQPDKGTTIICAATLLCMCYLAGMPLRHIGAILGVGVAFILVISLRSQYSLERITTMFNPWKEQHGAGYQLIQGFYALGSGGLFGVGVGLSGQKYSYLPMAHNDFIFAIIGEELGFMGTVTMLLVFMALGWAGYRIARYAPDLTGRLIAAGCTSMLLIQLFVNVLGVLGVIPLTGKPIPFVSYGGSSILSSLLLVGFIASVSLDSELPETAYDSRRRDWEVAEGGEEELFSLVGEATPRSSRAADSYAATPAPSFSVIGGGRRSSSAEAPARRSSTLGSSARRSTSSPAPYARSTSPEALRASRSLAENMVGRITIDSNGRRRIDLGPDASSRLRSARGGSR